MANFTSTIEYKFKVTNNLDKADAQYKKFNFYIGLPYSKRKYRHMQVINFITDRAGQHLFNVVLGYTESTVAAMTEDILRNVHSIFKPVTTKVMRITYTSINVGQAGFLCNNTNKEIFEGADWTGISGEYAKVKSFRTNGNDEVIGLIFDAADRSSVSARKNDRTNVVAKTETPDEVKVPKTDEPANGSVELKLDPEVLWKTHQKLIGDYGTLKMLKEELEQKVKDRDQCIKDLMGDFELITKENADLHNQLKKIGSKPDETQKTFRDKFIDRIVDVFREKIQSLSDDELLMKGSKL